MGCIRLSSLKDAERVSVVHGEGGGGSWRFFACQKDFLANYIYDGRYFFKNPLIRREE